MKILIFSSGIGLGGRGKALLSLSSYLSEEFDVTVARGSMVEHRSSSALCNHHGISPDIDWMAVGWEAADDSQELANSVVHSVDPDLIIGFDSVTNGFLPSFDVPTVAYCRRGISEWADEYWAPSQMTTARLNAELRKRDLDDNCRAVYPVWYLEERDSVRPFDEREYDVMVHSRKLEGVEDSLEEFSTIFVDERSWGELTDLYGNTKIFLFPNKPRFEPLGLMPIEAASFGCRLSLTRNSGVSEVYPECVYRRPEKAISDLLDEGDTLDVSLPSSPTDPRERVLSLVSGQVTV